MNSVIPDYLNRNLIVLFICQMIFVAGAVLIATVGGVVGHQLATRPSLATLPIALMVVGTASATIPAALIMQRIGRRWGFILAAGIAASGASLCGLALRDQSFWFFCAASGFVGFSLGFSLQFRFAAAESVSVDRVSHAVSFILLGSIAGAFIVPELIAQSTAADADSPYALAFNSLIAMYATGGILLLSLKSPDVAIEDDATSGAPRPMGEVVRQPLFVTAVLAAVVGQGVMTYVMTATPISMSVENDFSIQTTSEVIRAHVIAMYLPSLITPFLISRLGLPRMMLLGALAMSVSISIGLAGHHLMHYRSALVLLGIGWNFLFVAGTAQLVQTYRTSERFRAQAVNDFSVYAISAGASLLAGTVLFNFGWIMVMLSSLPALLLFLGLLAWQRRRISSPGVSA